MSIFKPKNHFQVEPPKMVFTAQKLIDILYMEIRNKLPSVSISKDRSLMFEGSTIPRLRAWGLVELIPAGKIEIKESARLNLVRYNIDLSRYNIGHSILLRMMTRLMILGKFPILLIAISIPIFWIVFAIAMPCFVAIKFDNFIANCLDKAGGRIISGILPFAAPDAASPRRRAYRWQE